jgi:hypothetical protein
MDELLGDAALNAFASHLSDLLAHQDPGGLASVVSSDLGAEITLNLVNAATELETAWNVLRLGNMPGARRQGRVASEFIGLAVLNALPRHSLVSLGNRVPVAKLLQQHPTKSVAELCSPELIHAGSSVEVLEPKIRAADAFTSFLSACEHILSVPESQVQQLRSYRKTVQHPASHATREVFVFHFEGFTGGPVGAVFDPGRAKTYRTEADALISLTAFLVRILSATVTCLSPTSLPAR